MNMLYSTHVNVHLDGVLDVFTEYGKKKLDKMYAYNEKAELTGEVTMKVYYIHIPYKTKHSRGKTFTVHQQCALCRENFHSLQP